MPRFLVRRTLGELPDAELDAAVAASTRVREERFPDVVWEHTHVVRTAAGLTAYCVYATADPDRIRAYSTAAGLPLDTVEEITHELTA